MINYENDNLYYLAESGDKEAMEIVYSKAFSAGIGAISDISFEKPLKYLQILADDGNHRALATLGSLYYTGFGEYVPQDYAKAMELYEKAAEQSELNDDWALNNLGYCYYYGRTGEVDYKKAYSCFSKSASKGNPNAMFKLGDMYYYGQYVEKDIDASFYWYVKAKKQDIYADDDYRDYLIASIAMRIGRALLFGEGTEIDLISALLELRLAEALFYRQIMIGDYFSRKPLPKVKEYIKIALEELDKEIEWT